MKNIRYMRTIGLFHILLTSFLIYTAGPCAASNTYYACDDAAGCNAGEGSGWNSGDDDFACTGKSEPCATIQGGIAKMSAGDTLIIGDGIYSGDLNIIDAAIRRANGNAGADRNENTSDDVYTRITAENFGQVILDGQGARQMIDLHGSNSPGGYISFIQLDGLGTCNSNSSLFSITRADHIKVLRCFAYDAVGTGRDGDGFSVSHSHDILLEACFSYGAGRKHFYVGNSAQEIIVRRCVVRHDRHFDYHDQDAFKAYDARDVEFQNCIAIDGDQGAYYTPLNATTAKAFSIRDVNQSGADGITVFIRGSISLNNQDMLGINSSGANLVSSHYGVENFIHWDSQTGIRMRNSGSEFSHCTIGEVTGTGTWSPLAYLEQGDSITNSLLIDAQQGMRNVTGNDYNSLWGVEIPCVNCALGNNTTLLTADPRGHALRYLPRIEAGSGLAGIASDGKDRGATILYKIGRDGTMWGEQGYNEVTQELLWPFPNEDLIKQKMQLYQYDNGRLAGDRGFASSTAQQLGGGNVTLTSYIWEYLGNPIPPEIYGQDNPIPSPPSGLKISNE